MDSWENEMWHQGRAGGIAIFNALHQYYADRIGVATAFEFVNEPVINSDDDAQRYADALDAWADRMVEIGAAPCGGSFSRGTPQVRLAQPGCNYIKIIAPVLAKLPYWSYHSYWRGRFNENDIWEALRYRLIYDEALSLGYRLGSCLLSEAGCDNGGGPHDGWRDERLYNGDWALYFDDIKRFDKELKKDAYVKAAFMYIVGPDSKWLSFEINESQALDLGKHWLATYTIPAPTPVPTPVPTPTPALIPIVKKCLDEQGFKNYVRELPMNDSFVPTQIYLHHTAIPGLADWKGLTTIEAMQRTYTSYGWSSGPHIFVAPEGIWLFSPLNARGTGVSDHNYGSWHVEMVGNYDRDLPPPDILEYTLWVFAVLMRKAKIDMAHVYFHRDHQIKSCPGTAITKEWFMPKLELVRGLWDGLPSDEKSTDPKIVAQKARVWFEERRRAYEAGMRMRVDDIDMSYIDLLYRLENLV